MDVPHIYVGTAHLKALNLKFYSHYVSKLKSNILQPIMLLN